MSWSERLSGNEASIVICRCSWVLAFFLRPLFGLGLVEEWPGADWWLLGLVLVYCHAEYNRDDAAFS